MNLPYACPRQSPCRNMGSGTTPLFESSQSQLDLTDTSLEGQLIAINESAEAMRQCNDKVEKGKK